MHIREFKVERWINTYELDAHYNLAETDAKAFSLAELLALGDKEALTQQLLELPLSYNPTTGSEKLRRIIADQYTATGPEEVLVTTGAIEADFILTNVLVEPGDTVIVQFPAYQVLYSVAAARGANVKYWQMSFEQGYEPDLDQLSELIDHKTKLIVLNNPHNPTGAVLSRDQLQTILTWAEERDFWVLCDEVYHGIAFKEDLLSPPGRSLSPRAISVGSMSKSYGLSGLRLGWLAAPQDVVKACWAWKDYTSISNSPLADFLAAIALEKTPAIHRRGIQLAQENLQQLIPWFKKHDRYIEYVDPQAGLVCFPRFNLPISTEEFCQRAYREKGVLLVPGECFDTPGHIRFGYGGDPEGFAQGLGELTSLLHGLD